MVDPSNKSFIPVCKADLTSRGWNECDFVFVSGDAYVDHSSFAASLICRLLESKGYKVGIVAQPQWQIQNDYKDFLALGEPRLAWLVSSGATDSMVAHYTANNKPRSSDSYSPGGKAGFRPDRALITYCTKIREFSKKPLIIGGIEASLRRLGHYDYWSNTVKHSILLDTKADLLIYGMGERAILEIAKRLSTNSLPEQLSNHPLLRGIPGTCWRTGKQSELPVEALILPSFDQIRSDSRAFDKHFVLQETNTDPINASVLIEQSEERYVVQEKPALPLSQEDFDAIMELPFTRQVHPQYLSAGGIPALKEVEFSLTSCRGCFGACAFCAITFHQGRHITARSHDSLIREAKLFTKQSSFKGYIHDVGGPSANFRIPACDKQEKLGACKDRQCLGDSPCPALKVNHSDYVSLLRKLRAIPGIKKVFIRSGIRYDYLMLDKDTTFLHELCQFHVSGQLKVAPEHTSNAVLSVMRKSTREMYEEFEKSFSEENKKLDKKQYLIPYYIASHPGADLQDALHTALCLKKTGFVPDQVQDFYPTPGTLATCMYYTGHDPYTGKEVYTAKGAHERSLQRALLQFNKTENKKLVLEALSLLNRNDLIPILFGQKKKKGR